MTPPGKKASYFSYQPAVRGGAHRYGAHMQWTNSATIESLWDRKEEQWGIEVT